MSIPTHKTMILFLAALALTGGCARRDKAADRKRLRKEAVDRHETVRQLARDVQLLRKEQQQALEQIRALRSEVHRLGEELQKRSAPAKQPPVPLKIVGSKVKLSLRSTPKRVRVYMDGKFLGITPLVIQVQRGGPQSLITFRKPGYSDYRMNVFTRQDQQILVALRKK